MCETQLSPSSSIQGVPAATPSPAPPSPASGEDLFSTAFHNAAIGMALVSPGGEWLKVNRALCSIIGYDAEELIGRTFQEFTHPDDLGSDLEQLGQMLAGTIRSYEMEKRYFRKDGSIVHALLAVSLMRDATGAPLYFISQIQDISDRARMEANLRLEGALLGDLMDSSLDAIYFKDRQSRVIRANLAMAIRHGYEAPEQLLGKTDFDFFENPHARQAFEDEQRIMATGEAVRDLEEKEVWLDGRITWASSTKVPRRDEHGEVIGIIGISRDITGRKHSELELERLNKQLMEISRQAGMSEVATSVLHNVGNVLTSVNVSCTLIADKVRKARTGSLSKAVSLIRENSGDLAGFFTSDPVGRQLPDFLLKLSEVRAEEQASLLHEINLLNQNIEHIKEIISVQQSYANVGGVTDTIVLADLVEDAVRMNAGGLDRHQVDVVRNYQTVPEITAQKHKVLQILVNLVRNAKHALTDSGRSDKRLELGIASCEEGVAVTVTDNGIGIPEENLTRIFALGFTTKKQGHGFGLHSGILAAREMGGTLTAHSDGHLAGATFTLALPLQPPSSGSSEPPH